MTKEMLYTHHTLTTGIYPRKITLQYSRCYASWPLGNNISHLTFTTSCGFIPWNLVPFSINYLSLHESLRARSCPKVFLSCTSCT